MTWQNSKLIDCWCKILILQTHKRNHRKHFKLIYPTYWCWDLWTSIKILGWIIILD